MKFFNVQTIAVTVFLLMYCAAGVLSGGVTYTRWGHTACPSIPDTNMLYTGKMAGTFTSGGGSNYLCLPEVPQDILNNYTPGYDSLIYGTAYKYPIAGSHNDFVPCAVCHAELNTAMVMVPAKTNCPGGWKLEYLGYIQSEADTGSKLTEYICVDKEQVSYKSTNYNYLQASTLYHVKPACSGIECPPYDINRVLACVVCTY